MCLRILATGMDFDQACEVSSIGASTCHYIFDRFLKKIVNEFYDGICDANAKDSVATQRE